VLAPDKDDPQLGAGPRRNNDFNYQEMIRSATRAAGSACAAAESA
jgi:hypothetical protein